MQFRGTKVVLRDGLELTDQTKQDIYTAWLQLQNLHRTQPGSQYKAMTAGHGSWKVSSLNGKDIIEILGYTDKPIFEEPKPKVRVRKRINYLPAIEAYNEERTFVGYVIARGGGFKPPYEFITKETIEEIDPFWWGQWLSSGYEVPPFERIDEFLRHKKMKQEKRILWEIPPSGTQNRIYECSLKEPSSSVMNYEQLSWRVVECGKMLYHPGFATQTPVPFTPYYYPFITLEGRPTCHDYKNQLDNYRFTIGPGGHEPSYWESLAYQPLESIIDIYKGQYQYDYDKIEEMVLTTEGTKDTYPPNWGQLSIAELTEWFYHNDGVYRIEETHVAREYSSWNPMDCTYSYNNCSMFETTTDIYTADLRGFWSHSSSAIDAEHYSIAYTVYEREYHFDSKKDLCPDCSPDGNAWDYMSDPLYPFECEVRKPGRYTETDVKKYTVYVALSNRVFDISSDFIDNTPYAYDVRYYNVGNLEFGLVFIYESSAGFAHYVFTTTNGMSATIEHSVKFDGPRTKHLLTGITDQDGAPLYGKGYFRLIKEEFTIVEEVI